MSKQTFLTLDEIAQKYSVNASTLLSYLRANLPELFTPLGKVKKNKAGKKISFKRKRTYSPADQDRIKKLYGPWNEG